MGSNEQLKTNIFEHCLGAGNPSTELLEQGTFPPNWVSRYVALLESATNVWRGQPDWPKEVVAAFHFASFYLEIRYQAWQHGSGKDNPTTRKALGEIRRHSEVFLLSPATEKLKDETQNA
jgi:hypothetical protein